MNESCLSVSQSRGNSPVKQMPSDYIVKNKGNWLTLNQCVDQGKKLFYYDAVIGTGEITDTLLFVHGNPESSYTYRKIVKEIEERCLGSIRIVAMDHIGFGLSDQADYEMVDMHHADNVAQLVRYLDLQKITLVVHDWGGPIGIGGLINCPSRVKNLVIMNTTVFPVPKTGLTYRNFPFPYPFDWHTLGHVCPPWLWQHIPPIVMHSKVGKLRLVAQIFSYCGRALIGCLSDSEKLYRAMFTSKENAKSSMRNVKQTFHWGHGYCYVDEKHGKQDNHVFYQNIQAHLSKEWGPEGQNIGVKAFFGEWDVLARKEVQQQWVAALPQMKNNIETFSDAGHFIEEHKYREIATGILSLIED